MDGTERRTLLRQLYKTHLALRAVARKKSKRVLSGFQKIKQIFRKKLSVRICLLYGVTHVRKINTVNLQSPHLKGPGAGGFNKLGSAACNCFR